MVVLDKKRMGFGLIPSVALEKLFAATATDEAVPNIPQQLLLATCHSTPLSSCVSFNFTDYAHSSSSSRPSTLVTSVSLEPSMFHRESQFHSRLTLVSSPRCSGLHRTGRAAGNPGLHVDDGGTTRIRTHPGLIPRQCHL
ncbi:hypothetical protein FB45DRAFT_1023444 [Roridomyces roridus]|uniref:Uncharacterized protein n=1 Tax=Roridomyces roridus TaxID=1738132 RepID=A0AAD7FUI4_9AGAR|nr:hypothetical protein FB45DRAFT_1023444 [Roridomyces roridus]